ncbi:hypothetical protein BO94DRAFT_99212 [Aspergillus sclerotioniger CBS 115572]|uniref:CBM-cenC domain-containing protein n=1 Tax=Aspergillus sclerotioniger CBS 115572 TaxID=1450535 RepID=A0A317WJM6_9EURO|nr:hypothetical protein BO94DRAFT_99212 [Aspergillus sclerotioniger CBS 115572]PWY85861.1 hypothetical protein BO94DRAFT_99212 [Aspergillus sclerotioniger CBS 115572]
MVVPPDGVWYLDNGNLSTEWLDTECSTNLHLVDDDAPGGGQCVYIPGSDYDFYQINQTVADAQVGQTYNASVSWRLKSDEYNADVPVTCSIDYRLSNGDTGLLLDIAHETVTVSSTDSGWMAVNGTWDATVSDFTIMITVQCSTEDTDYLPDIEIANVRLNIQIVSCPVQRSSSAVASSTQVSSTTPPRTPISSAVVSPTPVSHLAVPSSSFHATSLVLASSSVAVNRSRVASSLSDYPVSSVSPSVSVSRSRVAASSSSLVSSAIAVTTPVTIPIFIPGLSSAVPSPASSLSSNVASSHILTPGQPGRPLTSILATNPLPTASQSAKLATVPAGSDMTTSTIFTTSTVTITSCPSTITDCPASKRTTYLTTETILVSTTVCPITAAATATATDDGSYTSTILTTRTTTITSCAATVTNCPARSQTTYISTQTLVAGTTIIFTGKTIPAQTALPGTTNVSSGSNDAPVTTGPHGAGVNIAGSQGTPTDSSTTTAAPGTVAAASANAVAPEKPWPHVSSASSEIGSFGSTGSSSLDASSSSGSESRVAGSSASGVSASGSNGSGPSNSSSDYGSCIFSGSPSDSSSGPACCYTSDSDSGHISTELSGLSNYSTSGSAIGSTGPSRPSGSGDSRSRTGTSSAGSFASVSGSESFNSGSASASYDSSNSGSHNTAESTGQTPPNSDMDLTATSATGITGEYNGSSSPKTLTTSVESTSTTAEIPSTNSNSPINGNNVAAVSDGSSPIAGSSYGSSSGQNFPAGYGFSTRPAISSSVASMTPANSATAQASSTTSSAVGAVFTGAASAVPIQNLVLAAVAMVVGVILL